MTYYDFIYSNNGGGRTSPEADEGHAVALDYEVDLKKHDDIYHNGMFDPKKMSCGLRDRLKEEVEGSDVEDPDFKSEAAENEEVSSYVTKAEKVGEGKKGKWVEVKKDAKGVSTRNDHSEWYKKGKHDKWYSLRDPKDQDRSVYDSFAGVPILMGKGSTIADLEASCPDKLYRRSDKPRKYGKGKKPEGMPTYDWTVGGKPLSDNEASRLETALSQYGASGMLSPENNSIVVRPDFHDANGQFGTGKANKLTKKGNVRSISCYTEEAAKDSDEKKYKRVTALLSVYPLIKKKIFDDCRKGKDEAILAYFLMRTKIRIGGSDSNDGLGATDLCKGHLQLSNDGETFYASFNGKSKQWWHVTCRDKFLYDYIKDRKDSLSGTVGENAVPIFDVSVGRERDYLKEISRPYVENDDDVFHPHDFRRVGATRVAMDYLAREMEGWTPSENRKKYEDRIYKAVVEAAKHLNDQPETVWKKYVAPNILFERTRADFDRQRSDIADRFADYMFNG